MIENRPQRGQFLPDSQAHSTAMGQEDGEKWTAAVDLQPAISKSDRLPRQYEPKVPQKCLDRYSGATDRCGSATNRRHGQKKGTPRGVPFCIWLTVWWEPPAPRPGFRQAWHHRL